MTTEEMLLQLIEGQKQMSADISNLKEGQLKLAKDIADIKDDIAEIKEDEKITRHATNRNCDILEKLLKQLEPLNMIDIEY